MSERSDSLLVQDILDSISKIETYTSGFSAEQFLSDIKTQDAVSRNFSVIGEAASRLSPSFKDLYDHVSWREIKDFRNKLIHDYFGVDAEVVWHIIQNELSGLKKQISKLKQE